MANNKLNFFAYFPLIFFILGCGNQYHYDMNIKKAINSKNQGKLSDALVYVNNSVNYDTTQPFSYLLRGQIFALLFKDHSALEDYKHALRLDHRNVAAYFYLGISYSNLEIYDTAIINYDKAIFYKTDHGIISDFPQNNRTLDQIFFEISYVQIQFYRGISCLFLGKTKEAEKCFLFTLASNYEVSGSEYYLGVLHIQNGDVEKGCDFITKAKLHGFVDSTHIYEEYCGSRN